MKFTLLTLAIVGFSFSGCTDGGRAKIMAIGAPGEISCYSGGVVVYHGFSTGKISTESQSDGWFFVEKGTNNLIRVSGSCVIRN